MDWTFIYLMFVLKIPIIALLWIVWWAIHQTPENEASDEDDGGTKRPVAPRRPQPPVPRRGPHGDPQPPPPARARPTVVRGRTAEREQDR